MLVGRAHLICDVDERWNGPPPRCEPVLCPSPPLIANGIVRLSSNTTVFGTVGEYFCDDGYELVGESSIVCSVSGFWEGQPGFCRGKPLKFMGKSFLRNINHLTNLDKRPTTSSTSSTTTTSTTTRPPLIISTHRRIITPNTQSRPIFINNREPPLRQPPQIALIPILASSTSPPSYLYTRRTYPTTTTTTTTTTTRKPTSKYRITSRPNLNVIRTHDNEIGDSLSRANSKASARLNMGGIIALGVFGGFVFLAAVITIIVIIVRR